jgi:hypothetical protein
MLAALNQLCCPDLVANVFTMLMLLFNDNMTESEGIIAFCFHFDGMVYDMAQCKINLPPIILVMFFLWYLYPCYDNLLEQFQSWYKDLESASLDSIVADVRYHDEFKLVGSDKKSLAGKKPRAATAATNVNKQGKQWNSLLEWLYMLHGNSLKKWRKCVLASNTRICPLGHYEDNKHVPANHPILKDLNLKLAWGPPPSAASAPTSSVLAGGTPVVSPSPGGCPAVADDASASSSSIASVAPKGLVATVAKEYKSNNNFCWEVMKVV